MVVACAARAASMSDSLFTQLWGLLLSRSRGATLFSGLNELSGKTLSSLGISGLSCVIGSSLVMAWQRRRGAWGLEMLARSACTSSFVIAWPMMCAVLFSMRFQGSLLGCSCGCSCQGFEWASMVRTLLILSMRWGGIRSGAF